MFVGQTFDSWEELEIAHKAFCDTNFQPLLVKNNSKTVVKSNDHAPFAIRLNEALKYSLIEFNCVHHGIPRICHDGRQRQKTRAMNCPAKIKITTNRSTQQLVVKEMIIDHVGHEIGAEIYGQYPENRALRLMTKSEKSDIKESIASGAKIGDVLGKVIAATGKYEIPKGIYNIPKATKPTTENDAQKLLKKLEESRLTQGKKQF